MNKPAAPVQQQWESDRFVQPAYVDQRTLTELDGHLLAAAPSFESLDNTAMRFPIAA